MKITLPNKLKENSILIGVSVTVVVVVGIVSLIQYYKSVMRKVYGSQCYTAFKYVTVSIHGRSPIPYPLLMSSSTNTITYLTFLYISNWYYNINEWKHVFHKGSVVDPSCDRSIHWNQIKTQNPGVWLNPITNDMRIVVQTILECGGGGGSDSSTPFYLEFIDIPNIPIGEFFQLGLVCSEKKVEVYLNGYLSKTKILMGSTTNDKSNSNIYFGVGGSFAGYLSTFHYIPQSLSFRDIHSIYQIERKKMNTRNIIT